jgi:hypothetical protein
MRYYRVVKDHPYFDKGAIVSNECDGSSEEKKKANYSAVDEYWIKEIKGLESPEEYKEVVETCTDWFERVYPVKGVRKVIYLSREAARKAHEKLYQEGK